MQAVAGGLLEPLGFAEHVDCACGRRIIGVERTVPQCSSRKIPIRGVGDDPPSHRDADRTTVGDVGGQLGDLAHDGGGRCAGRDALEDQRLAPLQGGDAVQFGLRGTQHAAFFVERPAGSSVFARALQRDPQQQYARNRNGGDQQHQLPQPASEQRHVAGAGGIVQFRGGAVDHVAAGVGQARALGKIALAASSRCSVENRPAGSCATAPSNVASASCTRASGPHPR